MCSNRLYSSGMSIIFTVTLSFVFAVSPSHLGELISVSIGCIFYVFIHVITNHIFILRHIIYTKHQLRKEEGILLYFFYLLINRLD